MREITVTKWIRINRQHFLKESWHSWINTLPRNSLNRDCDKKSPMETVDKFEPFPHFYHRVTYTILSITRNHDLSQRIKVVLSSIVHFLRRNRDFSSLPGQIYRWRYIRRIKRCNQRVHVERELTFSEKESQRRRGKKSWTRTFVFFYQPCGRRYCQYCGIRAIW